MSFRPAFLDRFQEFDKERRRIKTFHEWREFANKWFDLSSWPIKTEEQLCRDSAARQAPIVLANRTWSHTYWTYDLLPEARYEYFFTLSEVANPLKFPDRGPGRKEAQDGWRQECPFCEILTDELGDENCLKCQRRLIYTCVK